MNIATCDDVHWCVAATPEEDLRSASLTTPASRVTFWEDVVEGGKIVLVGTAGSALTGACMDMFTRAGNIDGHTVHFACSGLLCGLAWSLAARWGDKTEKLGWRTFVKPVAILGVSTVALYILGRGEDMGLLFFLGGAFILGRMYGKREPATQVVRVRPDRVSFNLMTLFGDADDVQ